ncbi:hypothetical protein [Rhizobium phaseoli]|uniref:hypothetical protein n=1 Tax=Rhizobium phaseoli TaxID=396 RepID=UPI000BBB56BC|nr:hypothetical protein [Rhizobium phaseoli]PCD66845.1 hypothetical protein CO648_15415 [Rhizobium phaseoli]
MMNVSIPATPANVASGAWQPPATLPPQAPVHFRFAVGDRVRFGDMSAIIADCAATLMGRELYEIEIFSVSHGRARRMVFGQSLEPITD